MAFLDDYTKKLENSLPSTITEDWLINKLSTDNQFSNWGFTGCDLTHVTFEPNIKEEILRLIHISTTTKLPPNHPFKFLSEPSIKEVDKCYQELHELGIDGSGINVAVIDNRFDVIPNEIKDSLKYYKKFRNPKEEENEESHFHGTVVTTQLAGKNLGVAPKANLYFFESLANMEIKRPNVIPALKEIIELNKKGANIKVVNISSNYHRDFEILSKDFYNLEEELKRQGCYIIDSSTFGKNFTCINEDAITKEYYYSPWQLNVKHPEEIYTKLTVPTGGKLIPLWDTENDYVYDGNVSYSWAIPKISGMFALALQVNPNLTFDEFVSIANETKMTTEDGINLINPKGIMQSLGVELPKEINL